MESLSERVKNRLLKLPSYQNQILITNKKKKKPHIINVKCGIYSFSIDMYSLKCHMCKLINKYDICNHYLRILYDKYKIDPLMISYAWHPKISDKLVKYRKENKFDDKHVKEINQELLEILFNELKSIECSICLEYLWENFNLDPELHHCVQCKEIFHIKCINKYKKNECPVCNHKHK